MSMSPMSHLTHALLIYFMFFCSNLSFLWWYFWMIVDVCSQRAQIYKRQTCGSSTSLRVVHPLNSRGDAVIQHDGFAPLKADQMDSNGWFRVFLRPSKPTFSWEPRAFFNQDHLAAHRCRLWSNLDGIRWMWRGAIQNITKYPWCTGIGSQVFWRFCRNDTGKRIAFSGSTIYVSWTKT